MTAPLDHKLADNEVVFRRLNESVEAGFEQLKQIAREDDQEHMVTVADDILHFYCECSKEDCRRRLKILPSTYKKIHSDRKTFVILPDHDTVNIEEIIRKNKTYWVVRKVISVNQEARQLKDTSRAA